MTSFFFRTDDLFMHDATKSLVIIFCFGCNLKPHLSFFFKMLLTSISPINSNLPNAIKPSILIYNPITESEMFFRGCNKYKGVAKFVCCRLGFEKGFIWGLEDFMARVVVAHLESDMAVLLLPVQPPETILPVALRNTDSDYFCCFLTSTPTKL